MLSDRDTVVVTGLGVVAPGATGLAAFEGLLRSGKSSLVHDPRLRELNFNCHVSGQCALDDETLSRVFSELERRRLTSSGIRFALVAGTEALASSGLPLSRDTPDERRSVVFGAAIPSLDVLRPAFDLTDSGKVKKLGSATIELQMPSTPAAHLAARLRAGGQVTCNSAACATGTEALVMGYQRILNDEADVVLVGSTEAESVHLWSGFDALRVLSSRFNTEPQRASRPLSASAGGFAPACGAGALVLERKSHAVARNAPILAEVLGGFVNAGGQMLGGSMSAQNPTATRRCVHQALVRARVEPKDIDVVSGHLTATQADPAEVACWSDVLERRGESFPWLNAPKSVWGHALTASGAIELVAGVLQLQHGFLHASLNCEDVHPAVLERIAPSRIVSRPQAAESLRVLVKASFGFGDVNACAVLAKSPS